MIYVLKLFYIKGDEHFSESVGYFEKKEMATKAIENNILDLSDDGYFNYSCVMTFQEGVYSIQEEEQWYEWNKEKQKYYKCKRPDCLKNFCHFI